MAHADLLPRATPPSEEGLRMRLRRSVMGLKERIGRMRRRRLTRTLVLPSAPTTPKAESVAVLVAAPVFNPAKGAAAPLLPEELPRLEDGVAQFYGAVGNVLCSTLWDPGSSVNLVTPEFAKVLQGQGVPWEYCKPMQIDHGSGEEGGVKSAAPAVRRIRTDVLLCEKGLTFRLENVEFYVYGGALPDVILSKKLLERMVCLEQPGTKLLNWSVSKDDVSSVMIDGHQSF